MAIPFVREFPFEYGRPDRLSPLVTRVIARNPGAFTFTGTGTYLVGDARGVAVIDPGPADEAHLAATLRAASGPVTAILLTHTHKDHSAGAPDLSRRTGAPILAFAGHPSAPADAPPALDEGADFTVAPDRRLADDELVALPSCRLQAIHTPGHLSNHLCFALLEEQALFTGDHVMGWATTVVAPPDGDMRDYMTSLERLLERDDRLYYPTHGAPIDRPKPFVAAVKAHREARDAAILAVLEDGPATPDEIVARVYAGLDPALRVAAGLNVLAHLLGHLADGRVTRRPGDVFALH